jgi:hypothetical protein
LFCIRNIVMIFASRRSPDEPYQSRPLRLLLVFILLFATACTSRTDVVLPITPAIVGNSRVAAVELDVRPTAQASMAALDEAARGKEGAAGQPLAQLLPGAIRRATQAAGLSRGRALRLLVELDHFQAASLGSALFGGEDRLAGTVFVRDAETGASLGQLYVDVNARTSGLMALATRGGLRERLVEAFADRIAKALSGR